MNRNVVMLSRSERWLLPGLPSVVAAAIVAIAFWTVPHETTARAAARQYTQQQIDQGSNDGPP
jgi:hypothetical protein